MKRARLTIRDVARQAGVSDEIIEALRTQKEPDLSPTQAAALTVAGTFEPAYYELKLTYPGTGTGTVSGAAWTGCTATGCSAMIANGASVSLTANPIAPSTFKGWGIVCTGTKGCLVKMNAPKTVSATFSLP